VLAKSGTIAACMWVAKQAMTNGPDIHSSTHDLWELAPTDIQGTHNIRARHQSPVGAGLPAKTVY
jgi:hypothetical protein